MIFPSQIFPESWSSKSSTNFITFRIFEISSSWKKWKKDIQINYIALCFCGQLKSWIRHTFQRQSVTRNIFLLVLKSMFYALSWYFREELNRQRLGFVKTFHHNTESVCIDKKEKNSEGWEEASRKEKAGGKKKLKEGEKLVYDLPSNHRNAEDFIFGQIFLDTLT